MPTIGRTSETGLVSGGASVGRIIVGKIQMTEAGVITDMSMYVNAPNANWGELIGVVYADDAGAPGALLRRTDQFFQIPDSVAGWRTHALQSALSVSSGQVLWVGYQMEHDAMASYIESDVPGADCWQINSGTFGTLPDPFTGGTLNDGVELGVYATYTAGGGASVRIQTQPLRDRFNSLLANQTGVEYCVRATHALNGTVLVYGVDGTTDAAGIMTIEHDDLGEADDLVNGTVFKGDETINWNITFKTSVAAA